MLLLIILGSLSSCRTEDELIQNSKEDDNKFQVFTSRNGEPVNYPQGYKNLLEKYDSIYTTEYTQKAILKNRTLGKSNSQEYVELNIRSQELMMKNSERWILYPVVNGSEVLGIEVGILKNEETQLEFWRLDPKDDYYKEIIDLYRVAYTKKILAEQMMSKGGGNCGRPGEEPCDTGEVIIIVHGPNGPKANPNLILPGANPGSGDPGVIGGDCGVYGNCGGGGTGQNQNDQNEDDPCEKTKEVINNAKMQTAIGELKAQSAKGGEIGYKFKPDGTPSSKIIGGPHNVNFGDKTGYTGAYHNHTPTGIPMFSPPDIEQLLQFALAQGNYGNPSNAYMGMVAPNGMHYVMTFNGNYNDALVTFSQEELNKLTDRYQVRYGMYKPSNREMNNGEIENFFFKALKDMGLNGKANLQRIENDGTIKSVTLNGDNNTSTATPCPKI